MTATGPQSQTNRSISPAMRHLIGLRADLRGVSQSNLEWLGDDPVLGFLAPVYGFAPVAPRNMARYVLLRSVLDRVLKVLDAENISVVLLKGLYYAEHLYPGPALRPTQDIDLLVSARDFARAVMALQTSGWKLLAGSPYAQSILCDSAGKIELNTEFDPQSFLSPGEANFQDPTGVDIDLHWHISPDPFLRTVRPLPLMDRFMQSAGALSGYQAHNVFALDAAHELFYMLFNWHRNGFRSNYALLDMDLLLNRVAQPEALWERVLEIGLRHGGRHFLYQALHLRARLCGHDAGVRLLPALRPGPLTRGRGAMAIRAKAVLKAGPAGIPNRQRWFVQWMLVDRWRDLLTLLLALLFPERRWLRFRYGHPGGLRAHWAHALRALLKR